MSSIMSQYPIKKSYLDEIREGNIDIIAWIHDIKSSKNSLKIVLRDSSGLRIFKVCGKAPLDLRKESLVRIIGSLQNDVLYISSISTIVKGPRSLPIDLGNPPKDPKLFSRYSYLTIRSPRIIKTLKVQQWLLYFAREFLYREGFIELLPPMISPCSDPGLRGASKLKTSYYGEEYELMSSVIMFKQAAVASLEKVFFVARNVREEPPENIKTRRHLCEFTQIDVEWALHSMWDLMRLCERLIRYVIMKVKGKCPEIIEEFNPDLEVPNIPFKVIPYDEAVEILRAEGIITPQGKELTQEGERRLSELYNEPIWVIEYPRTSRGFYYLESQSKPGYNRDFNLILPQGYGEVVDGGEREYRYEHILERLKSMGENASKYKWFLELAKIGIPPSAGFGLGVERFTRYVLGIDNIWEVVPFPKPPGILFTP